MIIVNVKFPYSMLVYHGSDIAVKTPKILTANRFLDFGEGFYTTSSYEQADRWAQIVKQNRNSKHQIISFFDFNNEKAIKDLQIIQFDEPSLEWLRFVSACRRGIEIKNKYDIVMGPVANDNVYASIRLYETGVLSEEETIIRLKIEKIYNQILFHTDKSLNYLAYTEHKNISASCDEDLQAGSDE